MKGRALRAISHQPYFFSNGSCAFCYPRPVLASGYCRCLCLCVCINHLLVRTITRHLFKLGSPNLVQRSKTPWLRSLLFLLGNWPWPSRSNLTSNSKLTPFWACPNQYSPPILVRISEFGQQMHFGTVKIPVNSGLDWPWTSTSCLIPKKYFLHCGGVHWDCETVPNLFQCCSGTVSQSLHSGLHVDIYIKIKLHLVQLGY